MFQLLTWPAGNRRANSVAALEAAVNAAIGAGGVTESVLVVQDDRKDEAQACRWTCFERDLSARSISSTIDIRKTPVHALQINIFNQESRVRRYWNFARSRDRFRTTAIVECHA